MPPPQRSPALAFLVLAHKNPGQLGRLLARLDFAAQVHVHLDARAPDHVRNEVRSLVEASANATLVRPVRCYWGSMGIVRATLACLRAALESDVACDRVTLLSGQDYPIASAARIKAFFAAHRTTDFIESFPLGQPNRWTDFTGSFQAERRFHAVHLRYRSRVLALPLLRRSAPRGITPRGGSQWWSLTRATAQHVLDVATSRPEVVRFFTHTWIPDELFVQSLLPEGAVTDGRTLTFADWSRPDPPHPAILGAADVATLSESEALFARKFDVSVDERVLDLVDEHLLSP